MKNKIPIPPNGSRQQLLVRAINYFRSREGEPRLFTRRKLVLLALTALYAFSPIDLIPDFIPGVGQIDDLTVIAFTFLALFMPPSGNMAPMKTRNPEFPPRTTSHERILPHLFHSPPLSRWPGEPF